MDTDPSLLGRDAEQTTLAGLIDGYRLVPRWKPRVEAMSLARTESGA